MTKQEFDNLLKECGLKTYADLANLLNISTQTIVIWNRNENYPKYIKQALKWYKLSQRYGEKSDLAFCENLDNKLKLLEEENKALEKKLEYLESIKKNNKTRLSQ